MSSIYRFVSFESFVDIIQRKELAFVSPSMWEDPFEGFIFKTIKDTVGRKNVLEGLERLNQATHMDVLDVCEHIVKGQCWTRTHESDAMWRIYSYSNMSIRIEVDREKINELKDVESHDVSYHDKLDLEVEMDQIISEDGNGLSLFKAFYNKRNAFSHEEEVRLFTAINPLNSNQVDYVSFKNIDGFIKSVMLHPLAPNWFGETLRNFCELNNLNYLGKSRLYDFEI